MVVSLHVEFCSEWVYNTCDNNVKPEPVIFARRWFRYQYSPKL